MLKKVILIIGAGERLGRAIASRFLTEGFDLLLMSRNVSKLEELKTQLTNGINKIEVYPTDISDNEEFTHQLDIIRSSYKKIDVILYNVASINKGNILNMGETDILYDFKVNVLGLLTAVRSLKHCILKSTGTILITGGSIAIHPKPDYAALSITSAGLLAMVRCLSFTLRDCGIYVATILIDGKIDENCMLRNPQNIADQFWKLYKERYTTEVLL